MAKEQREEIFWEEKRSLKHIERCFFSIMAYMRACGVAASEMQGCALIIAEMRVA
jgi:hypothetical protein